MKKSVKNWCGKQTIKKIISATFVHRFQISSKIRPFIVLKNHNLGAAFTTYF